MSISVRDVARQPTAKSNDELHQKFRTSALDIHCIAGKRCEAASEYDHIVNANNRSEVPTFRTFAFDVRSLKNKIGRMSWRSCPKGDLEQLWSIVLICTVVPVE